jgi:hypothetical protein
VGVFAVSLPEGRGQPSLPLARLTGVSSTLYTVPCGCQSREEVMREMPVLTASCPIHDQIQTPLQSAESPSRLHAVLVQVGGAIGTLPWGRHLHATVPLNMASYT